ncbi:DNA-processing protein DprA [Xenophilus azovorans]|uniref:DNA-processing protein DprA n=1 Tax=Xenophilus azovorans TaxID=151755 RepID=UPI000570FBE1|nr:DNA-processing protein DprA [Xenophilus azovorans]
MERDELAGWLRLTLTPGVGDGQARRLLAAFGLPDTVFAQGEPALEQLCGAARARALREPPEGFDAALDAAWRWLEETPEDGAERRILTLADDDYPQALLQTADPPPLLYTLGARGVRLRDLGPQALAVVGSRNPTPQGAIDARLFARALAGAGLCVVSGLALGIDGAAHEGALEAAGAAHEGALEAAGAAHEGALEAAGAAPPVTVAVVGTGLDRVYPARHRDLAHRIAGRGIILSEFPLGTPPLTPNFPRRNRLIAGLSRGTLVVEAALASGSLITARLAVEQGREVFAIPGSIHSPQSRGCHALIRQGAKLVESVQDILEELRPGAGRTPAAEAPAALPRDGDALLDALGHDPASLDALAARTGLDAATLQARLLELELDGHVGRLPGGLFQRLASA